MIDPVNIAYVGPKDEKFDFARTALVALGNRKGAHMVVKNINVLRGECTHWEFEAQFLSRAQLDSVIRDMKDISANFRLGSVCPVCNPTEEAASS